MTRVGQSPNVATTLNPADTSIAEQVEERRWALAELKAVCAQPGGLRLVTAPSCNAPNLAAPAKGVGGVVTASRPISADEGFARWVAGIRSDARTAGVTDATFDSIFGPNNDALPFDPSVIRAKGVQPELREGTGTYVETRVDRLTDRGRTNYGNLRELLSGFTERGGYTPIRGSAPSNGHGVPPEVVIGIWGMESAFGSNLGSHDAFRSLASLGYKDSSRRALWTSNLFAAMKLVQDGDVSRESMRGSWAGAVGQTQFLPESIAHYGVDGDGDGRVDLRGSHIDALASAGHFLHAHGYRRGQPIVSVVTVPEGFDYSVTGRGRRRGDSMDQKKARSVSAWRAMGVEIPEGVPEDANARLLVPQGHQGSAFLIFDNYFSLLSYNNSDKYALAVALLSQRARGVDHDLSWPTELGLSIHEAKALQRLLKKEGVYSGRIDGVIGNGSQQGIRTLQAREGFVADGYPTRSLLEKLAEIHGVTDLPPRPLRFEERVWLQAALDHAGFDPNGVDGRWGSGAQGALSAYFESTGRAPDLPQRVALDEIGAPVLRKLLRDRKIDPGTQPWELERAVATYRERAGMNADAPYAHVVAHMFRLSR